MADAVDKRILMMLSKFPKIHHLFQHHLRRLTLISFGLILMCFLFLCTAPVISYFLRSSPERYDFLAAVGENDINKVRLMLDETPSLIHKCLGSDCLKALAVAVDNEHVELVQELITKGADIEAEDNLAMKWALLRNNRDIILILERNSLKNDILKKEAKVKNERIE